MADYRGTPQADSYTGTSGDDTIYGRAGDDELHGGAGDDIINGGAGDDTLFGDEGDDVLNGGAGADVLDGGQGDDVLSGGAGDDVLSGGAGDDELTGGAGADELDGGQGDDVLKGGAGDDELSGGAGDDELSGGAGDDVLDGGTGDDVITTGSGNDVVQVSEGFGNLTITDFDPTKDQLDLTALTGVGSLSDLTIVQNGDAVEISVAGQDGLITVQGVTVDEITAPGIVAVACFVAGTLIRTPRGDVPVESLAIGDLVTTASGARPVKWIGRRAFSRRFAERSPKVVPVRVRAGALGDNLPERDLLLSPEHALHLDGALVPAGALVNGRTIVTDPSLDVIAYHHVELETHDVIVANGALAETYVDHGNRRMFANFADYVALYGEGEAPVDDRAGRVHPTVADGPELDAIRARLEARATRRAA
ncbi:MAG: Hint domain-containing protein [Methylobacteriaceae bacterium]|nr:Hint domain-containing protein [Methylobacteriaceae bacterium]